MPRGARSAAEFYQPLALVELNLAQLGVAATTLYSRAAGRRSRIAGIYCPVMIAGAGAGASRVIEIRRHPVGVAANAVTLASVTVTAASTAVLGTDQPFTPARFEGAFEDSDVLEIRSPAGGTAFTAGRLTLYLVTATPLQGRA